MGENSSNRFGNGLIRNQNLIPFIIIWVISYWHLSVLPAYHLSKNSLENALKLRSIIDKLSFCKPAPSTDIWSRISFPVVLPVFRGGYNLPQKATEYFTTLSPLHLGTCMALGRKMFFPCEVSDDNHLFGKSSACSGGDPGSFIISVNSTNRLPGEQSRRSLAALRKGHFATEKASELKNSSLPCTKTLSKVGSLHTNQMLFLSWVQISKTLSCLIIHLFGRCNRA